MKTRTGDKPKEFENRNYTASCYYILLSDTIILYILHYNILQVQYSILSMYVALYVAITITGSKKTIIYSVLICILLANSILGISFFCTEFFF